MSRKRKAFAVGDVVSVTTGRRERPREAVVESLLPGGLARITYTGNGQQHDVSLSLLGRKVAGKGERLAYEDRDEWVTRQQLVRMARPGDNLTPNVVYYWERLGLIPDAMTKPMRPGGVQPGRLYNVTRLRAAGFFERVKEHMTPGRRPKGSHPRIPDLTLPGDASAGSRMDSYSEPITLGGPPEIPLRPKHTAAAHARPDSLDDQRRTLEDAIRARLAAELEALTLAAKEARARAELDLARLRLGGPR